MTAGYTYSKIETMPCYSTECNMSDREKIKILRSLKIELKKQCWSRPYLCDGLKALGVDRSFLLSSGIIKTWIEMGHIVIGGRVMNLNHAIWYGGYKSTEIKCKETKIECIDTCIMNIKYANTIT